MWSAKHTFDEGVLIANDDWKRLCRVFVSYLLYTTSMRFPPRTTTHKITYPFVVIIIKDMFQDLADIYRDEYAWQRTPAPETLFAVRVTVSWQVTTV